MSSAFANAYNVYAPLGTPYRISYTYEGQPHNYLPDFVGTLCDGGLFIAEAGREEEKSQGQALAKAEAARRLATLKRGVYWIGTDKNLSERRYQNLLRLQACRQPFPTYDEIKATLLNQWPWGNFRSTSELVRLFGSRWSEVEVEAAVWKLIADFASAGRLLVDLTEVDLDLNTPLALLSPEAPPILPDPLPSELLIAEVHQAKPPCETRDDGASVLSENSAIPGPTFDASALETAEQQVHFHRNLNAVRAVLEGKTLGQVSNAFTMSVSTLGRLVQRTKELGQIACVPYGTYHRNRLLRPEFQQLIRKLYTHAMRPTVMAVYEDVRLKRLAEELSEQEGQLVRLPTYRQVWSFLKEISQETKVVQARSGLKHAPHERMSSQSFVLSISSPALICQVDEHTFDQLIVASDGTVLTRRVHGAVLICVKTAAILGAILSLDVLREEDYMRLVKQTLEPKDRLTVLYECKHPWPCFGKPAVIFHDRGKIFTSARATAVLVDRLGITTQQAPAYAPSAKGTVEALFTWITRKFSHRLPGTTKAKPSDRGTYDSANAAEKAGMTFDVLEKLFIQAIVDGYMQEWDKLRRQTRIALWEDAVHKQGLPRWMGSQDDLKLLLMKAVNRKNRSTGRYAVRQDSLSFLGRQYVSPGLLNRLHGREIDIYYDRRDICVIYLFLNGELVGEAFCTELMGKRMSVWEADAHRQADAKGAKIAAAESLQNRQRIQEEALSGRKLLSLETKRLERARQFDLQRQEIHPEAVQATLQALISQSVSPPPPIHHSGLLPPAVPEEDPPGIEIKRLKVRKWRPEDD
ncbi:MAG: Mu transposase C-terminal domain-containing protein [Candidatus Acidiferrum sp.]